MPGKYKAPEDRACQAWTRANLSYQKSERCGSRYAVAINGKRLCVKHGRIEAFALLLSVDRKRVPPALRITVRGIERTMYSTCDTTPADARSRRTDR